MYYLQFIRWLGEKYDGVRCFWNPEEKQLYLVTSLISFHSFPLMILLLHFDSTRYSRNKQIIGVHAAINKKFGHVTLDGEIWYLSLHLSPLFTSLQPSFFCFCPLYSWLFRYVLLLIM